MTVEGRNKTLYCLAFGRWVIMWLHAKDPKFLNAYSIDCSYAVASSNSSPTMHLICPPSPPPQKKLWLALFSISLGTAVKPRNKKKTAKNTKFLNAYVIDCSYAVASPKFWNTPLSHLPQCALFAPPPPKKKLWYALFSISLGTAVKPSRNKKNQKWYKIWGANKVHYGRCASGRLV